MSILKLFLTSILFVSSGIAWADYENTLKKQYKVMQLNKIT